MLGLDLTTIENLRFRLYPGIDSEGLSKCLKPDSTLYLNQKMSILDYQDLQCIFINKHQDPEGSSTREGRMMGGKEVSDVAREVSNVVAQQKRGKQWCSTRSS